jgi:hypothetical protein
MLSPDIISKLTDLEVFGVEEEGKSAGEPKRPNQVLVNEYLPGQGIDVRHVLLPLPSNLFLLLAWSHQSWRDLSHLLLRSQAHTDGSAFYPTTSTISLLWPTILYLHPPPTSSAPLTSSVPSHIASITPPDAAPTPIILEPRSLFVLANEAYLEHKHEIRHADVDDFGEVRGKVANWSLMGEGKLKELTSGADWEGFVSGTKEEGRVKRQKRISLTVRRVEKTKKGLFKMWWAYLRVAAMRSAQHCDLFFTPYQSRIRGRLRRLLEGSW